MSRKQWVARAAGAGALAGALMAPTVALAEPPEVDLGSMPALAPQLTWHLAPGGQADFTFTYGGSGDVATIVLLPEGSTDASAITMDVLDATGKPVATYESGGGVGQHVILAQGEPGTYVVEVRSADPNGPSDFVITAGTSALAATSETGESGASEGTGDSGTNQGTGE